MAIELFTVLSFLIFGSLLVYIAGIKNWGLPAVGFIIGVAVYISIVLVQFILVKTYYPIATIVLLLAAALIGWVVLILKKKVTFSPIKVFLALAIPVCFVFIFQEFNFTKWSFDSFKYLRSSELIVEDNHEFVPLGDFSKRLLAVPVLHAPAQAMDEHHLPSITPLIALACLVSFAWLLATGLHKKVKNHVLWIAIALGVLLLLTNNRFIFNSFYINSHMLFAAMLLLITGFGWLLSANLPKSTARNFIILQAILLPALVVSRAEASIILIFALAPTLLNGKLSWKLRSVPALSLGLSITLWQGFVTLEYLTRGYTVGASIWGPLIIAAVMIGVVPFLRLKFVTKRANVLLAIGEIGLWLLLMFFIAMDHGLLVRSTLATIDNLVVGEGSWGLSLVLLVSTAILFAWYRKSMQPIQLRYALTTFVPLSMIIAYLRDAAYRVGNGDSLNRMLMHFLPLLVLYLVVLVVTSRKANKQKP